ncbi:hypothetical protein FI667_g12630, partial [Globisporangium splendens]
MTDPIPVKPRVDDSTSHHRASSSTPPSRIKRRGSESQIGIIEVSKQKYDSPFDASLAAVRKRTQHEKLWDHFAKYALQFSSEDPTRMRVANVIKLLQDCDVIDGSSTDEAEMIEKDVSIVCESFLKSHPSDRNGGTSKKLSCTAFLALLSHFAKMSDEKDPSRAYDSLVRTCIERQLKPRVRVALTKEIQECKKVLTSFDEPLTKIFGFYASVTHAKLENLEPKTALASPPHMGYAESVIFGRMYGLIALGVLTTTEFATIYIDSLPKAPPTEYDRVMTYPSFCELLVRLSQKACPDANMVSDKRLKYVKCVRVTMLLQVPKDSRWDCSGMLRGLFQLMWLACASNSPRALKITDVLKIDRVDVMKVFLLHFEKFWRKEHYENYVGNRTNPDSFGNTASASVDAASVNASISATASSRLSPPPSPTPSSRPPMPRRLSLCVQTSPNAKNPDAKRTLQRRFSMQPTPTSPPASPPMATKQKPNSPASVVEREAEHTK